MLVMGLTSARPSHSRVALLLSRFIRFSLTLVRMFWPSSLAFDRLETTSRSGRQLCCWSTHTSSTLQKRVSPSDPARLTTDRVLLHILLQHDKQRLTSSLLNFFRWDSTPHPDKTPKPDISSSTFTFSVVLSFDPWLKANSSVPTPDHQTCAPLQNYHKV